MRNDWDYMKNYDNCSQIVLYAILTGIGYFMTLRTAFVLATNITDKSKINEIAET